MQQPGPLFEKPQPQPQPQPQQQPQPQPYIQPEAPRPKHHGRARRVFRGYLMIAGGAATIAGLVLLIISLLVEINKWM